MNTFEAIKSRRSTRKYKNQPVEWEKLSQVIEAGRYAPSGGNSQTTHFLVVQKKEVMDELARLVQQEFAKMEIMPDTYKSMANSIRASKKGNYTFHFNAPILVITANKLTHGNNMADCACALENMMLMANELDLGSCWINQLRWLNENEVILQYLKGVGLADDERVYGAAAIGYADTADGHPVRKPLDRKGNPVTMI